MSTSSDVLYARHQETIAQGALTNSKRPECFVKGVYPTHLVKSQGCFAWDVDGKRYVDFISGMGSNLLGAAHPEITGAIAFYAQNGTTLSLSTPVEVEAAEMVKGFFPFIDHLKFLKTGTEACAASIRIARAHTGRDEVLSEGYHGWSDDFVSLSPPALGVPARTCIDKFTAPAHITEKTAAVIIEPIVTEDTPDRRQWLQAVRDQCTKVGALLIFDEVITGFRYLRHGVSNATGVTPDLICLGKAMGGGMPLAAVGGKKAVMSGSEYFVSSTFAGEMVSLGASLKFMKLLRTKFKIEELWEKGEHFKAQFNELHPALKMKGYGTRGVFDGDPMTKALFFQEACRGGLLFGASWFLSFPHVEHLDSVLHSCRDILTRIKAGNVTLQGEMPRTPFAQKMREAK